MTTRSRPSRSNERGSSIAETLFALSIAATASLVAFDTLRTAGSHQSAQAETITTQVEITHSLDLLIADIRHARFAPELSTQASLENSLPLIISHASGSEFVEWSVTDLGIIRSTTPLVPFDPRPGWTISTVSTEQGDPTFTYLDAGGNTVDSALTVEETSVCTASVAIQLYQPPEGEVETTVHLATASFRLNLDAQTC